MLWTDHSFHLKGELNRRCIALLRKKHFFAQFLVMFGIKKTDVSCETAILRPAVCVSDVRNKASMCGKSFEKCHVPAVFCSSLAKSKLTWLCPNELGFEAEKIQQLLEVLIKTAECSRQIIFEQFVYAVRPTYMFDLIPL